MAALAALLGGVPHRSLGEEHGAGTTAPAGPVFVRLRPIVLPIVEGDRVAKTTGIVLSLELAHGKTEADLDADRVRLRDAFITELYAYLDQHADDSRAIDTELLKQRLTRASARVLGPGVVRQVLILQAFERRR